MNKVVDYLKQYIGVISIVLAVCILLTYSLSYFKVNTESKRAAEMYIGELKYTISINGTSTNTLTVPSGTMIANINVTNLESIDTFYKLLYSNNPNISIKYFNQTKDMNEKVTSYSSPSSSLISKGTNTIKLLIDNTSSSNINVAFKVAGGYKTNTLNDVADATGYKEITVVNDTTPYFCTTNNTLTQGLVYTSGQYTYRYKAYTKTFTSDENENPVFEYENMNTDGWSAQVTNTLSTTPLTSKICSYINDKPLVNMDFMFESVKATSVDISSLDSRNVTSMRHTFSRAETTTLDLSKLNTSKVINMGGMFCASNVTNLDVSHLDTSNVTSMSWMFMSAGSTTINFNGFDTSKVKKMDSMFTAAKTKTLDLSSFDTSNVTDMQLMFYKNEATTIDLSSFDTSSVTTMDSMFQDSRSTTLDLSGFNTSKVTDMNSMFLRASATSVNVENFDTSNVADMSNMFSETTLSTIDVSSFDTSKVTDTSYMFADCPNLRTIYASNKFVTSSITDSGRMFDNSPNLVGGAGTKYNSSYRDKTYARIDGGTSSPGYFTSK